jgi:hypothetical protein
MRAFMRFVITTVAVAACGGDDGPGPGSANVEGTWNASLSNLTGGGASCSTTTPIQLSLRQTGSTFTGSYSSGVLTCTTPTESFSASTGSGSVVNGQVSGDNVTFDLGTAAFHHTGLLEGTAMSGTAEWMYDFGIPLEVVALSGNWSATKQ